MNFRYDINGLRAIAVIAVVLFHFNSAWVPGGFAGVDVFFVISGFLMTGIIFKGLECGEFKLLAFYLARAKRIIPALLFLCLVVLLISIFFFFENDYDLLFKHALSSISFISNFIYWSEAGYFDTSSSEKLFLHTWSLSVEWQFYIIYPIVLIALKEYFSLEKIKRILVVATILGFAFSVLITMKWPNPAYYLLPTRAWEMMVGGLVFLYPWQLSEPRKKTVEIIGFALIVVSYFFISSNTPWPGYLALFPVAGAYLIIASNRQSSTITNNFIFQYIGKLSYSIYLWHWPVSKFIGYFYFSSFGVKFLVYSLITLATSMISYHLIESSNKRKVSLALLFILYTSFLFTLEPKKDHLISHEKSEYNYYINQTYHSEHFLRNKWLDETRRKVLVIGDSHSKRWGAALASAYPNIAFNVVTYLGCDMTIEDGRIKNNVTNNIYSKECEFSEKILNDQDLRDSYDLIILASFRPFSYNVNKWRFDLPKLFKNKEWLILGNYYQLAAGESCKNMSIISPKTCFNNTSYPIDTNSYKTEPFYNDFNWKTTKYLNLIESICGSNKENCPYEVDGYRMMDDYNHHHMIFIAKLIQLSKNHFDNYLLGDD